MDRRKEGIGELYHQETKYRREAMPRGGLNWAHQPSPYKEFPNRLKHFQIQPLDYQDGRPIWEVIAQRRSIREFSRQPITFSELSQLIWATQGITSRAWGFEFRATPSAGALYPIETYIIVNRVEEISPGIYHYNVKETKLFPLKEGDFGSNLCHAGLDQEMLEEAACVFIWTAIVERSKWKYRERAYRYIYMDVGHIGQNLYLAATALNLGCCTVGAFFDEEVDRLIEVDGKEEISVYLGAVGRMR
jgi:SagB-type dehydrogenase family enzyme